jgi:uncharacterized protein
LTLAFAWIVDRPARSLALVLGLTLLAVIGLVREFSPLLPEFEEVPREDRLLGEVLGSFDLDLGEMLVVVRGESLLTRESVTWMGELAAGLEGLDEIERVFTLADVPDIGSGAPSLLPPAGASASQWSVALERVADYPLVRGLLLSADGRTLLLPVALSGAGIGVQNASRRSRAVLDGHPPPPGLRAELTGRGPLWLDHREAFVRDHRRLQVLAFSLVAVLALLLFRNLAAAAIAGLPPVLGLVWTWGALGWMGESPVGLTRVVMPVMLLMIGFTDAVHLMLAVRRARADGLPPRAAARAAVVSLGGACGLTSLTTAVGFASLITARSSLLQQFGIACSIGALLTFLSVVLVLPLACASPLGRRLGGPRGGSEPRVGRALERLVSGLLPHARSIAVLGAGLTLVLGVASFGLRPNDRLAGDQPAGSRAAEGLAWVEQAFGGVLPVQVRVRWPDGLPSDYAEDLRGIEQLLAQDPAAASISSMRLLLAALPAGGLQRAAASALIPPQVQRAWLRPDLGEALVHLRLPDVGTGRLRPIITRLEAALTAHAANSEGRFELALVGMSLVDARWLETVTGDLARSLGLAAAVLLVVLTLAFRSIRHGLLTVVPNLFPLVATAAVLRLTGASLSFGSVTALVIALGIAVDDTVHLLSRYRRERAAGSTVEVSLRRSVRLVGEAMVLSTLVMVTGFGVVLTSELPGTAAFGALACATIATALVGDLVLLPALLRATERD